METSRSEESGRDKGNRRRDRERKRERQRDREREKEHREGRKVTVRADRTSEGNVMVITSIGTNTMTARIRPSNIMDTDVNEAVNVAAAEATNATEGIMDGDTI